MTKNVGVSTAINTGAMYGTTMQVQEHQFLIDEPVELGGEDKGASPMDHLCAALASCKAITLRMYANRKKWDVEVIQVSVKLLKEEDVSIGGYSFFCELEVKGNLSSAQKNRLLDISKACPVQRLLMKQSKVQTVLTTGTS